MRHSGLLCGICLAALISACSDDKDDQNTSPLTPQGGTGGTSMAAAGSSGSGGAGTGGSGNAGSGGSGNGEGAQPSGIAGAGQNPNNGGGQQPDGDAGVVLPEDDAGPAPDATMSFFVTSRGGPNGGNFGGLAGADAFCTTLASAASPALAAKTWHAYLSTSTEDARDRIGNGPWRNFAGVIVANDVEQLHDQAAGGTLEQTWGLGDANIALDETGATVPSGQPAVLHDILTGTNLDGTASANTCSDWTAATGTTVNGHSNRGGGGDNPSSWNSAHATGCAPSMGGNFEQGTVTQGGGRGSIYCFATD
jgi:hypothetical protein